MLSKFYCLMHSKETGTHVKLTTSDTRLTKISQEATTEWRDGINLTKTQRLRQTFSLPKRNILR